MHDITLITNYQHMPAYRASFNALARQVFDIDFDDWYQRGFWSDRYTCFSYLIGESVVANISVNTMDLTWEGQSFRAGQLGTVMTHPDYRLRGLAASLMNTVLERTASSYDFLYLFANESAVNFYPKFGFTPVAESDFTLAVHATTAVPTPLHKLNVANPADEEIMQRLIEHRAPVSSVLGVTHDQHLLRFYCYGAFADYLYYLQDVDAMVLCAYEGDTLQLYDIISPRTLPLQPILDCLLTAATRQAVFHFTPDQETGIHFRCTPSQKTELFMRPVPIDLPCPFRFPATSHA